MFSRLTRRTTGPKVRWTHARLYNPAIRPFLGVTVIQYSHLAIKEEGKTGVNSTPSREITWVTGEDHNNGILGE
jgi:hypothetical protein